jgi:hypothetical protein
LEVVGLEALEDLLLEAEQLRQAEVIQALEIIEHSLVQADRAQLAALAR